ncbi:MAG TPA: 30S ribosomal protein S1, partial [Anaerovoracaceae bacterium]|nr:30S ribosomal protein S1 [Anaerovoracaceae bacterium]
IGVAAGASTPERIIKEVISTMSESITEIKEMQNAAAEDNTANEETVVDVQATENVPVAETESDVESDAVSETEKVPEVEDATETESDVTTEEASLDAAPSEEESNPMDDFMDEIDKQMILPNRGEVVEGEIVHVTDREIVVNLGCKKDGIIPKDELILKDGQELTDMFKAGDNIQAKVVKTDDGEGNILLSKKKLVINEHWDEINEALDNKAIVNAKVVREVKGGVIAVYKEVSGFIPMSQLSDRYVEKADEFIGKVLPVKVSRVDQRRNKAVFSHKAHLMEEKQKRIQEIWNALNVGDIVEGTVMRFTDYGAFVDIGGLDGLLHISEISWGKLKHPSEALDIGERIDVKILSMNSEKGKISLGLKQTQPEPWSVIDERYEAGQTISGKVVQIKEYGAFVELEPGLDGLVHISEIAHKRVTNIMDELSIGEIVQIKILDIDKERRRISLSIKETLDDSIMSEGSESAITDVADKVEVDDAEDADVSEDEKAEIVMDEPESSEEEAEAVAEEAETEETEETKESAE